MIKTTQSERTQVECRCLLLRELGGNLPQHGRKFKAMTAQTADEQYIRLAGQGIDDKIFNKSRGRLNTKLGIPDPESAGN